MTDVSVVMAVFNGAPSVSQTVESLLAQQDCLFEIVVVDDGSSDGTAAILDAFAARDSRVRVIHQDNTGLTRALARGCAAARGEFIARQDCGDTSMPGRLAQQSGLLAANPGVVMTACATRFLAPGGEALFVHASPGDALHAGLAVLDERAVKGPPHHGGTMFRRAAYERCGGYRAPFVVAQDIDLWLRLAELGRCVGTQEVGYVAAMSADSISARRRSEQLRMQAAAVRAARLRRAGKPDAMVLEALARATRERSRGSARLARARFLYFVASCLRKTDPAAARRYYWDSFREHPLMVKSLLRMGGW